MDRVKKCIHNSSRFYGIYHFKCWFENRFQNGINYYRLKKTKNYMQFLIFDGICKLLSNNYLKFSLKLFFY